MAFSTADEHLALRYAFAGIAAQFGNDYYTRKAEAREFTSELWQALGKHGYLGINIPEAYGGGAGLVELVIVCEENSAQGCPCCCCSFPAPSAARDLRRRCSVP
jgi:alkylation response protein AidB-like acyl-CoA dehydrogenase